MGRMAVPALLALLACSVQRAAAKLEGMTVTGSINTMHSVATAMQEGHAPEEKNDCEMEPPKFWPDIPFYVLKCRTSVEDVTIHLQGTDLYVGGKRADQGTVFVDMPRFEEPHIRQVTSCPAGSAGPQTGNCTDYTWDVYRVGGDLATLATLGVSSTAIMSLEPIFNLAVTEYEATTTMNTPFSISAGATGFKSRVGISFDESHGVKSGLDKNSNGCLLGLRGQEVWELPGFKATGVYTFSVCAIAPDGIHTQEYKVKILVKPSYSMKLESLGTGPYRLVPDFSPDVTSYILHIPHKVVKVPFVIRAVDPQAKISLKVDADDATEQRGSLTINIHMHDNENLEAGEPPQWSREVAIQMESADGNRHMTYMFDVKQEVSNFCDLTNISAGGTPCQLIPEFQPNITEYRCVFWWEDSKFGEIIPFVGEKCKDCEVLLPSDSEFQKSHLSLKFSDMKKRPWNSGESWRRDFLYGEYHTLPIRVLSADKFTHRDYTVYLERASPWWMKAATTRAISSGATTISTIMAFTSAGNVMALAKQVQFMDLTTEINNIPEVYQSFAANLKGFSLDVAQYLPDMGLPSSEDVTEWKEGMIKKVEAMMPVSETGRASKLLVQYCYAKANFGILAGNGILSLHDADRKFLFKHSDMKLKSLEEMKEKETSEIIKTSRRLSVFGNYGGYLQKGVSGFNSARNTSSLRGLRRLDGPGDALGSVSDLGDLAANRSLDDYDDLDMDRKIQTGAGMAGHGKKYSDIVSWTDEKWDKFKGLMSSKITADMYLQNHIDILPCTKPPMSQVIPLLSGLHQLELMSRMMHSYAGSFLIMVLILGVTGSTYILYYKWVMQDSQRRLKVLEPGFLWIFLLDYALIGFMKNASKLLVKQAIITFFFWKPQRWMVQAFCLFGILLYPVVFLGLMVYLTYSLTHIVAKGKKSLDESGKEVKADYDPGLVYNKDKGQWLDPKCREIRVVLDPKIPRIIPVIPGLMTNHVRCCIPILTADGEILSFAPETKASDKGPLGSPRGSPDFSKASDKKVSRDYLGRSVEKEKDEELRKEGVLEKLDVAENDKRKGLLMKVETDLESEMEKVQVDPLTLEVSKQKLIEQLTKEKQLAQGIRMRAEKHTVKLEKEIKVLSTEASGGALAEHFPPYFEEVENLNVAEKIKGFKPVKCREDCEQLDEEEQFAMRQFLETLIRKEERLLRYNILAVNMKDGFLKPREPVTQQGGAPEKWWCDEAEDDANLDNFTFNHNYIETSSGDRLVYTGHSRSMLSWFKVGTEVAGDVQWMAEPDDGWDDWLDKQQKDKLSSQKYADKWQWIYLDQPSLPWNGDEEHEKSVYFCGYPLFQKTTIPLYKEFRSLITSQFREKVPATITAAEKNEIRKWMWKQLLPYTELKLKLGWVAGLNSKFKNQSVQELVEKPFSKVYSEIETADRRQAPGLFESENLQEDELLSWTIMKLEDLYPDGAEPWWNECDKPADSEQRVMFDHESFWMTGAEPDLKKRRKENPLIPEHGYFTSSVFSNFPDDSFGIKRYVLKKPDGSHTRVDLNIQVKHVMPLMRYTSSFKVNVPVDNLELPNATTLRIVLGASKKGEEYNYCVDRATTLISIGVLASNPSGPVSATVFLAVKTLTFLNRWYVSYKSDEYEEEGEEGEEAEEDAPAETGEEANFLGTTTEGSRPDQKTLWQAFREVDISVLFLQCCTLALLAVGQYGGMPAPLCAVACIVVCSTTMLYMNLATFQKEMEKNLQRFANTMVTGYKTAQQVSWRAQEWLNGENPFGIQFVKFESQVADKSSAATEINFIVPELGLVLSGKPKVDESLPMDEKKRQQMTKQVAYYIHKPTNVSDKRPKSVRDNSRFEFDISNGFCVALDIAQLKLCKPIPQIRATIQCVNHNESRICRQEFDSFITLYFPGDWDGEEEPSFATPEGKKKIEELLSTWKMQVDSWMEGTLGAVTTARTLTSKIQHHIESLLKAPYIGSTIRNVVKMKIAHILLPSMAKSTCLLTLLEDRMVYATCIYDSESPLSAVPKGRMSLFGRLKKFAQLESSKASLESFEAKLRNDADDDVDETLSKLKPESIEWMVQMDDYFDIPLPAAVNKVRLMFWVQDFEGKTEDLLGFTDEFDLRGMVRQQDDEEEDGENPSAAPGFFQAKSTKDLEDEERLWLHTRWTANSRANTLEPEKADEIISAEDMTRWQSLKQWASSFYSVPVTKEDLQMSKGYVDIVVKGSLKHEQEMDVMDMLAVKDLVAGKSNMNQKKLERHTDRFFTFAKIFGVSVDRASITCVTAHIETMKNILQKQVSHEITADDGIRRSLQKRDGLTLNPNWKADVQAVISSLEKQVVEQETFLKANEMVVPGHKLEMRRIGTRITVPAHKTFQDTLEARLKEFQLAETLSSKNILHYVMLSEHVKPSKLWRPDAICPHVCSIVTAEFDDVTDVRLTGGAQSLEIAFKRQQHANAPDVPVMVHGRMGFKAEGLEGAEALWQGQKELWLYWDGASRWIISPFKGESAPYGPGQGQAPEHFMWVQDPANSPEKVNQSWMVWKENVNHPKGGLWQQDLSIRILSNFIGKKQETRADVLLAQVEDDDLGVKGGLMDEILKSVRYLLVPSQSSKATPELKDCLLSLEGNNIGFAWKDFALEELAPFRKFLLGEFSTYQGIWLHLTRNSKIKRTLLQRNLTKMLAESRVELAVAEKQEQEELARDAYRLEQEANDASAQQEMKKKRSAPPPKKGIMSMLGGGMFKSKAKSSANLTAGAEDVSQSISTSSKRPIEMESISGGNKDAMHKFLDALGSDEAAVGEAVNKIVDALDSNKDGLIMVAEVAAFLNSTFQDELLCDMQVFFQVHPSWQKIENAWAEMSEDFEVSRFEFANAIKDRMDKFAPLAKEDKNSKEKADKLFAKFDVQMSEGISLTELIPVSGDDPSDVDQSMVKFLVPLNYIREIRIEGARQVGLEEKRTMRFQVNKQFETSKEWNELRKGLNPEWEPNPGFESLQVTMMPLHLEMWKQVIKDCGMTDAQEWIRFYDGAIEDHPELANTFLRQGEGIQRWTDGRTYKGQWEYHAYAGEGKLYATHEDMKSNARPLYEGQWKDGKRNGSGILRWEQDISERRRKATFSDKQFAGVGKVYEGNFRDDLFHGRGKLKLANAVAQRLPGRTMSNSESTTGAVPYPNTEATQLLSFDGYFDSDWLATYKAVTEHDTMFLNSHPKDTKDLALQKVSKREGTHRTDRYVKYFDLDAAQCQKSGQAMPDLAIAMYQHRNGDALHLKKGTALFADGSTYEGPFEGGLPHGQGIVTQYDAGKKLAWYEGQWSGGKFHGEGTHATADGVEYKGGWADGLRSGVGAVTVRRDIQDALGYVSYKGQFANDKFDGTGELVFGPQGACLYEGEFKDGNREGKGAIYSMDPSKALRTHGLFQKDVFATTMTDQCWVHLSLEDNRGRFFYGLLTKDGNIGIFGTLYDEDAGEDEDFMECFKKGVKYEVEDPRKPETLKYTQYCGAFKNNMAHGTGVQHFEGSGNGANGGNYVGDFMDGKRHGRGTWTTKKDWVYRPITSENVPNWENDLMHGIAIVEDKDHVHENVIYTKGTCQMPFTEAGPPKTGFDASGLTQALPDVARKRQFNLPLPTLKDQGGGISSFLGRVIGRKDEGWDPEVEMKYLQLLGSFPSSRIGLPVGQLDRSKTAGSNLSLTNSTAGDVGQTIAFVREPTDLSMPEEDVMISGGTGVNEELNGVYFKLTGTFGVKAFKMVKVQSGAYVARYLYKDVSANVWCISPKPLTGICVAPGCAFADDEKADHPGVIKQPWFVWHSFSKNLKSFGDTVAESGEGNFFTGRPGPIDHIVSRSIVGFEVTGAKGQVSGGLMLRISTTLYGRPVFEAESSGQFLFWLRDGGSVEEGHAHSWEDFGVGVEPNPKMLFEMPVKAEDGTVTTCKTGRWIIARDIGEKEGDPGFYACCEDMGITPDQIHIGAGGSAWKVLEKGELVAAPKLKLTAQEWARENLLEVDDQDVPKVDPEDVTFLPPVPPLIALEPVPPLIALDE